jgi:hypothetical protein
MRIALLLLFSIAAVGCFSPQYKDGDLHCAPTTMVCPDGYHCAVTGTCYKDGHNPPRPPGHFTAAGGGAVDVKAAGTHQVTLSVGQPLASSASAMGDHTVQFGILRDAVTK